MHAVLEIAEPSVFVGAVCPCLQLAPIGGIGDVSGSAAVMLPVPQMTPLDRLVSVFVMVVGMMHVAEAQLVRGFISGTVTDETNAVIPGVEVKITSKATNISREGLTNETGFYRFAAVEPGDYSVEFNCLASKPKRSKTSR